MLNSEAPENLSGFSTSKQPSALPQVERHFLFDFMLLRTQVKFHLGAELIRIFQISFMHQFSTYVLRTYRV